jgi:hypothetical protein
MPARHVVVDGSNMATEGSSLPSLKQLDEAVREYLIEYPDDIVTVVVDATFGHRIPTEERKRFEQAESAGEIVSPPAGAIGRGDAFLLRVADKVGAVVLSNDSFQEFHGEYEWLFDKGRLMGAKPVPGVGWIFTPRTPVRGPKSRESVKEAKRKRHAEKDEEPSESGLDMAAERSRGHGGDRKLQRAIAAAVEEAVEPVKGARKRRRRRRGTEVPSEPLNEPFNFITFIAAHQLGDEVEGSVDEFSSHGAFISVDGARCYLPLSAMGDVPPRSAREVLRKGERRTFIVQAFDAMRRGIELALPGFARPAGTPTAETIDAEIHRSEGALEPVGTAPLLELVGRPGSARAPRPAVAKAGVRPRRSSTRGGVSEVKATGVAKVPAKSRGPSRQAPATDGVPAKARRATEEDMASNRVAQTPAPARTAQTVAAKARSAGQKEAARQEPAKKQPAPKQAIAKAPAKTPASKTPASKTPVAKTPASKTPAAKPPAAKTPATKSRAAKSPASAKSSATTSRPVDAKPSAPQPRTAKATSVRTQSATPASATKAASVRGRATTASQTTRAPASTPAVKASGRLGPTPAKKATTAGSAAAKSPGTRSPGARSPGTGSPGTGSPGTRSPGTASSGTKSPGTKSSGTKSSGESRRR